MLKVTLVAHTENPERLVAAAAKFCYSPSDTESIFSKLDDSSTQKFLDMLVDIGHESPVEHASFTFAIEGVSRSLLAQITRHRIASFSVQSQRYVKENSFTYVTPPEIAQNEQALKLYCETMEHDMAAYLKLTDILFEKHFNTLMASGVEDKKAKPMAEKMAIEDARYVLPNACETKIMMTMNTRSLYNFFKLRCCNRAQWEVRELAFEMLMQCKAVAGVLFKKAGPACLYGTCSEGRMSCGKMQEVRMKYGVE